MELLLSQLPESLKHYTGKPIPKWMAVLHPDAAKSIVALDKAAAGLSYTDVWRSAELSLHARATKQGVQPPGFSAHNYGLAIDFDMDTVLKKFTYEAFLALMANAGWHCHRRDRAKSRSEWWHFNYLGDRADLYLKLANPKVSKTWADPIESRIQDLYGSQLRLSPAQVQTALKSLKMYSGDVDGKFGPLSTQAVKIFQKAWGLTPDGQAGPRTQRTLAFVTATKKLLPIP